MKEQRVSVPSASGMTAAPPTARDIAAVAARACPVVETIKIDKSSDVHIGPKIVSVVQNIDNSEKIKGRFLGLEWVSKLNRSRRLRCSVAVFLCWALVVCVGLTVYLSSVLLYVRPTRLDIDLPFHLYLLNVIKNTTRPERIACAIVGLLVIGVIALIVYFTVFFNPKEDVPLERPAKSKAKLLMETAVGDTAIEKLLNHIVYEKNNLKNSTDAPHEWNITRQMWMARDRPHSSINETHLPLRMIIINHSVTAECYTYIVCAAELRSLQGYFINHYNYDIPYNFFVGNDGRIYEGRGWNVEGAHTIGFNRCSLGIGFIGDYRNTGNYQTQVTELQLNRTLTLIEYGIKMGYIHKDYAVMGARDIYPSESPGYYLYNAIRKWEHYNTSYVNNNCTAKPAGH